MANESQNLCRQCHNADCEQITAALLEALEAVLAQHCEYWEVIDKLNQRTGDCLCSVCQTARAAIAQAKEAKRAAPLAGRAGRAAFKPAEPRPPEIRRRRIARRPA